MHPEPMENAAGLQAQHTANRQLRVQPLAGEEPNIASNIAGRRIEHPRPTPLHDPSRQERVDHTIGLVPLYGPTEEKLLTCPIDCSCQAFTNDQRISHPASPPDHPLRFIRTQFISLAILHVRMQTPGAMSRTIGIRYHPPMRTGVAQTNPVFGQREANLDQALDLIARESADLWVLPELFATGYQFATQREALALAEPVPDGPTTSALARFSAKHACHIVAGLPERDGDRLFNSAVLVGPDGFLACYRKVHLFYEEKLYFRPGDRPFSVIDLGDVCVGMMICFDHLFPESARSLALQGADVICHPANLVMPDLAQRTMAIRALENGVYTATANRVGTESRTIEALTYTGRSQIVAPDGEILIRLSPDQVEAAVIEIDVGRARDKAITRQNDKLNDRRPDLYQL